MDFNQSKFSTKTTFSLQGDGFSYSIKDRSGLRSNFIRYADVFLNQKFELEDRNEYYRNVGLIWVALGAFLSYSNFEINFWLYVGAACLAIYYFVSVSYSVIPTTQGNILVIKDETHDEIVKAIQERMRTAILTEVGDINFDRTFEDEKRKYRSLLDNEIIGESQFNEYLETMEKSKEKFKNNSN
jgi:hypothetical protein